MRNIKGISGVITAVILIALVLGALVIVWAVVNNIIKEDLDTSQACFGNFDKITLNDRFTCYNSSSGGLRFSLNIGNIDVDKILVSISGSSRTKTFEITNEENSHDFLTRYNAGLCSGSANVCSSIPDVNCNTQTGCGATGCLNDLSGPLDCSQYDGNWANCNSPCSINYQNCSGTPTATCVQILNQPDCDRSGSGCSWNAANPPGTECEDAPGLSCNGSWDLSQCTTLGCTADPQFCNGGIIECNTISAKATCETHAGTTPLDFCLWDATCSGNAKACNSFGDENSCTLQAGCSWDASQQDTIVLPEKNGGLTYIFTESVGTPESIGIEIAPVISGKQCEVSDRINGIDNCLNLVS
ncbi:MAG: hypothetical protein ACE5ES_01190 [Candidatus Nanoarchaeia archaeon]